MNNKAKPILPASMALLLIFCYWGCVKQSDTNKPIPPLKILEGNFRLQGEESWFNVPNYHGLGLTNGRIEIDTVITISRVGNDTLKGYYHNLPYKSVTNGYFLFEWQYPSNSSEQLLFPVNNYDSCYLYWVTGGRSSVINMRLTGTRVQ